MGASIPATPSGRPRRSYAPSRADGYGGERATDPMARRCLVRGLPAAAGSGRGDLESTEGPRTAKQGMGDRPSLYFRFWPVTALRALLACATVHPAAPCQGAIRPLKHHASLPLSLKASHTAAVMRSPFSAQVPPRLLDCPQTLWVTPVTTCVQDIQVKILYAVYSAA